MKRSMKLEFDVWRVPVEKEIHMTDPDNFCAAKCNFWLDILYCYVVHVILYADVSYSRLQREVQKQE